MKQLDPDTQEACVYIRETVIDLVEDKDTEIKALREANLSLKDDLESAEREVELLKAKVEELAPPVYREARSVLDQSGKT